MPVIPSSTVTTRFASVSDLATYLQRDFSAQDSATAELVLDLVSAAIRSYTGQTISRATSTVDLFGSAGLNIVLPERPVVSVDAVLVAGTALEPTEYSVANNGLWSGSTWWGLVPTIVQVTYTHGFATIPDDIKGVCLSLAERRLSNPGGVRSEQVGPDSIEYSTPSGGDVFAVDEKQILNRYRRRVASVLT